MEAVKFKTFIKVHRRPLTCIKIILVYWVFLFIAVHTTIYDDGVTKGVFNILVSTVVMVYRFLSISLVPALTVMWFFAVRSRRNR